MPVFKIRKGKKGQAKDATAVLEPFQVPPEAPAPSLSLPDTSSFRTSLIMPYLSSRFDLLKDLPLDQFESALRHQRHTGVISGREERVLLEQFHMQALREGKQLPDSLALLPEEEDTSEVLDSETSQPQSLHDFHRRRVASEGSSMFGHMGSDQVRQKPTVSGQRSARVPKPQPDPNSSLASSADLNQEAFSFTTSPPRFRSVSPSVQDLSQEDSLQESLADDLDSQHNVPLPRSRPPREGGSLRLSRNDVQRLSRVLDEIVTDYTQGPQRTTTPPPSESIHVGPQPRDFIYTNLHARSSSRALLQDENAEEEVDPLLSRSRKTSPNLSLIDAPSTSQGMLTPSSLDASADSNSLLAKTPTPPPHASPDVPQSATNTPTQQNTGDIPSVNAPHTLSPRFREPSLYTTSESMFPSPVSSPQKSAAAAADHSSWKQQSRALDSSAAVGRSQLMSSRFGQGRIASEETDLSTAPSGYFSPRLATRRSNSSLGSSFCEESSLPDALSLSEELVWQDECPSELPRRPSSTSVTSAAPSAISRGESIPTTSGSSAIVHDRTMGFGLTHDPQTTSLHLTELERDQCLRGLRMSDLTAFQSKLVASASEQSGGRIAYDPSPGISQRAIFDFVGPTPQPHRATESELDAEDTEHLHIHHTESATCSNDSEPLHTPSLVGSGESPITDLSAPSTPPAGQVLHWDFRHPFSSLSDDRNSKDGANGSLSPLSSEVKPLSNFQFPRTSQQDTPSVGQSEELPVPQPRLNPTSRPTADTNSVLVRSVAAKADAATAALKSPDRSASSSFGLMRRRKSSKNLKPSAISTPTLLSSSFKQDEAPPVPSHPSLSPLQSSSTSLGASSPPRGGGQQRISDQPTGLSRFLSRLKRKPEGHAPQLLRAASVERFGRPETSLHPVRRDPPDIIAPPNSAPFDRTRFGSIKSVEPLTRSASANTSPQSKMPTPAAASRAPVSYDVVKTRKRAGSLSQSTGSATGSISPSPGSSSETWTPLDPETSMASWRSSVATEVERPNSSAESVRKLREAADALGLDQSGVDQLVANATPPITVDTIPEEPSPLSGSQTPRNVVRRTIIVGSAGDAERISQMATNGPDSTLPHRSSSLKSTRAHPLRRSQTFSHSFSNESPAHASNHRKINSETAPKGAYTSFAVPSHGRQASLDSFTRASPVSQDKPFKNLTPAPSIPLSSSASHNSHRSSRQVSSRASRSPAGDHEVLASGQLSAAGDTTSRRLSSLQPSIQPGDRVEINEMDDGSFFWQHVRSKLRSDRPASEISNFTGFHSRSSSAESLTLPVTPSGSQPRAARPSILNKSHMEEPQGDMKLVWANKSHRRTRSKEGVGSLPYIRRHQDEGPAAQRRSQYSVSSDVEIFEADDEMMTHLIEDLTSHMDQGAFNLIRAEALHEHGQQPNHSPQGSIPGLRLRSPPPTSPPR